MRFSTFFKAVSIAAIAISATAVHAQTKTFTPSDADLGDLDHHYLYTWRIDNYNMTGKYITKAELFIDDIRNWDPTPNKLHMHLLDTAKNAGITAFQDDNPNDDGDGGVTDLTDDFANPRYHSLSTFPVAAGTADTYLASPSFSTIATDYTYTFTNSQLVDMTNYFRNGKDIALGFDSDCHFYNNGIKLKIWVSSGNPPALTTVPEPGSIALLGAALLPIAGIVRRNRRK